MLDKSSLTLSQTTILDPSNLKEFVDDNFKSDENGRTFSKKVEKHYGKGRNCSLRANFSFSYIVFKRLALQICKKNSVFWGERVIFYPANLQKQILGWTGFVDRK